MKMAVREGASQEKRIIAPNVDQESNPGRISKNRKSALSLGFFRSFARATFR